MIHGRLYVEPLLGCHDTISTHVAQLFYRRSTARDLASAIQPTQLALVNESNARTLASFRSILGLLSNAHFLEAHRTFSESCVLSTRSSNLSNLATRSSNFSSLADTLIESFRVLRAYVRLPLEDRTVPGCRTSPSRRLYRTRIQLSC